MMTHTPVLSSTAPSADTLDAWREMLAKPGELEPGCYTLARRWRKQAVPLLIDIARGNLGPDAKITRVSALHFEGEPEPAVPEDWAPFHAVELLVELRAEEALPTLIEILGDSDIDDFVQTYLYENLDGYFGQRMVEPALAALPTVGVGGLRVLLELLMDLGSRDPRLFDGMLRLLHTEGGAAGRLLHWYGDARALPAIEAALRRVLSDPSEQTSLDVRDLTAAYRGLANGAVPRDLEAQLASQS